MNKANLILISTFIAFSIFLLGQTFSLSGTNFDADFCIDKGRTSQEGTNFDIEASVGCEIGLETCEGKPCGYLLETGICDGEGNLVEDYGNTCTLVCTPPSPETGYTRQSTGSCGRTGLYKIAADAVCDPTSCTQSPSKTIITGSWFSTNFPNQNYKSGDTIQIKINGVSATNSFIPLTECRMNKTDKTGNFVEGIYFNNWGTGDITFSYTIQQTDPSGEWVLDYCGLYTDYRINGGWDLVEAVPGTKFNVTTGLEIG